MQNEIIIIKNKYILVNNKENNELQIKVYNKERGQF